MVFKNSKNFCVTYFLGHCVHFYFLEIKEYQSCKSLQLSDSGDNAYQSCFHVITQKMLVLFCMRGSLCTTTPVNIDCMLSVSDRLCQFMLVPKRKGKRADNFQFSSNIREASYNILDGEAKVSEYF